MVMLFFTMTVIQNGYADLEAEQMLHEAGQGRDRADLFNLNAHRAD